MDATSGRPYTISLSPDRDRMATSTNTSGPVRKVYVPLRLPPALVAFVDAQARRRFLTRNAYIQGLVTDAAESAAAQAATTDA